MKADSVKLVSHDDLPSWSIDNEYITRGYRAPGGIVDDIKGRAGGARKSKASPATRAALEGTLYEHSTVVVRRWREGGEWWCVTDKHPLCSGAG